MTAKKHFPTLDEYKRLIQEANKHNKLYFEEASPVISDYEFDLLIKEIEKIEEEHPEWILPSSPTQKTGSDLKSGFRQVVHSHPMLSLANTYSEEEVREFAQRMEKYLETKKPSFHVELKIDGVASSIRYEEGKLVRGVTRGDGKKGDDVTDNVRTIKNLPHKLQGKFPKHLEIRGEIYMPLAIFQKLNEAKEEAGEEVYANPRNAAAGSLKLLNPAECKERELSILFYDAVEGLDVEEQSDIAEALKSFGLPVLPKENRAVCATTEEVIAFAHGVEKRREALPFEIDGIVIKLNTLKERSYIGFTGKCPRWAVAYKFAPEQAITRIEAITVQVGRTGVLTPVAELLPVKLAGSTISRATLHNQDEIDRKDIRVSDTVVIEKGGDVIPKVVSVVLDKRAKEAKKWHMPRLCPSCHKEVVRHEGEVAYRCENKHCPSRNLRRIEFFVAKGAMDIEHFGEKVIEKLVQKGFLEKPSDIYTLTEEQLSKLEGFKEKSIDNLLRSIEASKETTLARFIFALGIKYVGITTAELIAERAQTIEAFLDLQQEELLEIEGIGPKVAESVSEFLSEAKNVAEIERLLKLGVHPKSPPKKDLSHPFAGKTFVLTGTLEEYARSEAAALIKARGGKVASAVSSLTDYLLVGKEAGSKLAKAEKLGIKILTEKEFKKAL